MDSKIVSDWTLDDFIELCNIRQIRGNEYGDSDLDRNNILDGVEEIADLNNIISNRLRNRLINQQGYIGLGIDREISKLQDSVIDIFVKLREMDSKIDDKYKTDGNGGCRVGFCGKEDSTPSVDEMEG